VAAQSTRAARNAQAAHQTADEKYRKGNYDGAIADWTKAIAAEPDNANWSFNRGMARAKKKDHEGAISDFDKAISLKPDMAAAYAERGISRYELGRISQAQVDLDRAVALEPAQVHNRARLHLFMGALRASLDDENAALKLDPANVSAYLGRATVRQALGDLNGAIADLTQATTRDAAKHYASLRLFVAKRLKGLDGFPDLARAVTQWPEAWDRSLGRYLIDTLTEADLLALAEKTRNADTRREQLCEAHFYVGIMALAAGNPTKARTHLEKCAEQNVRDVFEDILARAELGRLRQT
jgi:lipoprotein NlpI